jgi:hypothetical protein
MTTNLLRGALVLVLAAAGCSGGNGGGSGGRGGASPGGSGGDTATGGSGGAGGFGAGGSGGTGGATGGRGGGGSGGGGSGGGGSGGAGGSGGSDVDASPGGAGGNSDGAAGADGGEGDAAPGGGPLVGFYEAEAPNNTLFGAAARKGCGMANPACGPPETTKPDSLCCFGKMEVRNLLRGVGGVQFNGVSAPADGMYDITWWYHCGNNDNFHDPVCRGEPHTASGCRPGQVTVNGTALKPIFEFPCFPGAFDIVHAATTTVPLKSGAMNTIKITASFTNNDAADIDAISVYPAGQGLKPHLPKSLSKE